MMHLVPTLENEDPRLTAIFTNMRPANSPKYGLGYLEEKDRLIPECRFKDLPKDCKRPSVPEIHKFYTLMDGCSKHQIPASWMKQMLNWDIYTHPQGTEFGLSHTPEEKIALANEWKAFMEKENVWISFYSWKKAKESDNVLMNDSTSSSSHSWTATDGSKIETSTSYPPFKSIVLGEGHNSANAYPLVQKDTAAVGAEGRIQKVSEQVNWTNTALTGLEDQYNLLVIFCTHNFSS